MKSRVLTRKCRRWKKKKRKRQDGGSWRKKKKMNWNIWAFELKVGLFVCVCVWTMLLTLTIRREGLMVLEGQCGGPPKVPNLDVYVRLLLLRTLILFFFSLIFFFPLSFKQRLYGTLAGFCGKIGKIPPFFEIFSKKTLFRK